MSDDTRQMDAEGNGDGAAPPDPVPSLEWQRGREVPPFVVSNPKAVGLCEAILAGTVEEIPAIFVSQAIAVQIYRLIFDSEVLGSSLAKERWSSFERCTLRDTT